MENKKQITIDFLEKELESLLNIKELMENKIISSMYYDKLLTNIVAIKNVLELLKS